ncbi:hypothetical protein GCM10009665_12330 [Kitasatospora nipponensis]|uniref:Uncharacterized protein n=1 Tax=Kitasatospora nipponensis TaxID=258049 RepID=A0ABN1VXD0_9ACTN
MTDQLDDYWDGDFTLRQDTGPPAADVDPAPGVDPVPVLPIERLAAPEITVRGRNLAVLLAPVYRALTS